MNSSLDERSTNFHRYFSNAWRTSTWSWDYWASREQLIGSGLDEREMLLGLYEGIPLPDRYDYNLVLPDKITLFQRAIESICSTDEEVVTEVRATIIHEVAHHFGIDDEALHEIGID